MKPWLLLTLVIAVLVLAAVSFFMFTATLSAPTKMDLYMPKDNGKEESKFDNVRTRLTLILLKNDRIFGYYGDFIRGGRTVAIDKTTDLISDGWKMFSKDSLVIIIKPGQLATYKNTVDILDAMTTNQIERYAMADVSNREKEFLKIDE